MTRAKNLICYIITTGRTTNETLSQQVVTLLSYGFVKFLAYTITHKKLDKVFARQGEIGLDTQLRQARSLNPH